MFQRSKVLALALWLGVLAGGCSNSAIGTHADVVTMAGITVSALDRVLLTFRRAHLNGIVQDAAEECTDATPCSPERQAFWRETLQRAEQDWRPVLACRDLLPEALASYVDALETARIAPDERASLTHLAARAARLVLVYEDAAACVNGSLPEGQSFELPTLPPSVYTIAEGLVPQ